MKTVVLMGVLLMVIDFAIIHAFGAVGIIVILASLAGWWLAED